MATLLQIATPEAVPSDDLHHLESEVLARFRRQLAEEQAARTDAQRLYLAAIGQIVRLLRGESRPAMPAPSVAGRNDGLGS